MTNKDSDERTIALMALLLTPGYDVVIIKVKSKYGNFENFHIF